MLDTPTNATAQRVDNIVRGFVQESSTIPRDRNLQELGLTSMDMVNLMLSIEAEFDLTIPAPKLTPTNFRTIENIETLLRELGR